MGISDRSGYTPPLVTITRTADTNAYTANDVIGAATGSTAAVEFTNIGRRNSTIRIIGSELEIDATAVISGEGVYRLHLYSVTPPSALGDNAAFDIPSGDRTAYRGFIDLGVPVDLGSTLYVQAEQTKDLQLGDTSSLFAYLVTIGAHTPTSGRVYKVRLHTLAI